MKSDIEIARSIELKHIDKVATSVDIPLEHINNYGRYIAKVDEKLIDEEKAKIEKYSQLIEKLTKSISDLQK